MTWGLLLTLSVLGGGNREKYTMIKFETLSQDGRPYWMLELTGLIISRCCHSSCPWYLVCHPRALTCHAEEMAGSGGERSRVLMLTRPVYRAWDKAIVCSCFGVHLCIFFHFFSGFKQRARSP